MRNLLSAISGLVLITVSAVVGVVWTACRIYVPEDQCAVLVRKTGTALPAGQLVATEPGQKGIQETVLGPGRHFYDPIRWEWKLEDLTVVPAGDPSTWEWVNSLNASQREDLRAGKFRFKGQFPQIGVVTRKVGPLPPVVVGGSGQTIVSRKSGHRGILREVLTPGTYKINPFVYEVQLHPATVIPAGFVGVITNLVEDDPFLVTGQHQEVVPEAVESPASPAGDAVDDATEIVVRPLAQPGRPGTLRDVLQPGVYFINPKLQKVTLIEIGFNEFSELGGDVTDGDSISFPSDTGYLMQVGVTVVWGIDPDHAAQVINEFGNVDRVLDKVILPQLRSICRNIGSTYAARDFIQGEKRELFQRDLTQELQRVCGTKNIEVLLALVRDIEVLAPDRSKGAVTENLRRTIQESFIAIENRITKEKQTEAATVKAQLEEIRKQIDIARETVVAGTRKLVAEVNAEGEKSAAEVDAQAHLDVAGIQQQVAELDARRIETLGQANADVEKMKKAAEAEGYRLLIEAFGSPQAFNLYTFAQNFEPQSIRLFFAGEGTFWTDLTRFEELGAAKVLDNK